MRKLRRRGSLSRVLRVLQGVARFEMRIGRRASFTVVYTPAPQGQQQQGGDDDG